MEFLSRAIGPLETNVCVLADARTREAIAIDTAIPCLDWLGGVLVERGWTLKLIVSTHGHWDHVGDNAVVQAWTRGQAAPAAEHALAAAAAAGGDPSSAASLDADSVRAGAPIAVHPLDRHYLIDPKPLFAPFDIPPSVPAVDLVEGGRVRFGEISLEVLHTPGHTEGSVCLFDREAGLLMSGDTLFAGSWGRTDLPGGSEEQMAASLARLSDLEDGVRVQPGHGPATLIGRERRWLDGIKATGRLPR